MRSRIKKPMKVLSVLIPTIPSRLPYLAEVVRKLHHPAVNVWYLGDIRQYPVGVKRNMLMDMVRTPYLTFIDDDDEIHDKYFDVVLANIEQHPEIDCFGITGYMTREGTLYGEFDFDSRHTINHNPRLIVDGVRVQKLVRKPNHTCIWKSEIAKRCRFPDINLSEDHKWADMQQARGYSFMKLETDQLLYHYKFSKLTTETRRK